MDGIYNSQYLCNILGSLNPSFQEGYDNIIKKTYQNLNFESFLFFKLTKKKKKNSWPHFCFQSVTSTIKGAIYWLCRIPKDGAGAFLLCMVTWKKKNNVCTIYSGTSTIKGAKYWLCLIPKDGAGICLLCIHTYKERERRHSTCNKIKTNI